MSFLKMKYFSTGVLFTIFLVGVVSANFHKDAYLRYLASKYNLLKQGKLGIGPVEKHEEINPSEILIAEKILDGIDTIFQLIQEVQRLKLPNIAKLIIIELEKIGNSETPDPLIHSINDLSTRSSYPGE